MLPVKSNKDISVLGPCLLLDLYCLNFFRHPHIIETLTLIYKYIIFTSPSPRMVLKMWRKLMPKQTS